MEDSYYALDELQKELLELGYNISKELAIANPWTNNIILALVRTNPEEYGNLLELQPVDQVIYTDASWLATPMYQKGWTSGEVNQGGWKQAYVVMDEPTFDAANAKRIWSMKTDTIEVSAPLEFASETGDSTTATASTGIMGDSTHVPDTQIVASDSGADLAVMKTVDYQLVPSERTFFKKTFELKGLPVFGEIKLSADDAYNLFLNGEYIATSTSEGDSANGGIEKLHNISDFLVSGLNVLAIECSDTDESGTGMRAVVKVQSLPGWDDKEKTLKFEMLDKDVKQNLIFNKNILIY